MKLVRMEPKEPRTMQFGDVGVGEVFLCGDMLYMRVARSFRGLNAVRLVTGDLCKFFDDDQVWRVHHRLQWSEEAF